jgi:hypothetical protein
MSWFQVGEVDSAQLEAAVGTLSQVCPVLHLTNRYQGAGFQYAMNQALSNAQLIDYLIQINLELENRGSGLREVIQSDEFRRIISDPIFSQSSVLRLAEMLRSHTLLWDKQADISKFPDTQFVSL